MHATPINFRTICKLRSLLATMLLLTLCHGSATAATVSSSTTLAASTSSGMLGALVTLTANVAAAGPVSHGQVALCDADAPDCTGVHRLSVAQLNGAGVAVFRLAPTPGTHHYAAWFLGTGAAAPSQSVVATVSISMLYPSFAFLASTGTPGDYTLTATVSAPGVPPPTGTVFVQDAGMGNALIAQAPLTHGPSAAMLAAMSAAANTAADAAAVGDWNNDGNLDVATVNTAAATVSLQLGNGIGESTAGASFPVAAAPSGLMAGDFNGDGNLDLAVASQSLPGLQIFLGDGVGNFSAGSTAAGGACAGSPAAADLNGDGNLDLVCLDASGSSVDVWLGDGTGHFTASAVQGLAGAGSFALGDVNGDGVPDLLVAERGSGVVEVLLGNGQGGFAASPGGPISIDDPTALVLADWNGDGNPDLALLNSTNGNLVVLLGHGDGTFSAQPPIPTGIAQGALAVADLDSDGNADLVLLNQQNQTLVTRLGNGDGTFQAPVAAEGAVTGTQLIAGDLNNDGSPDVLTYGGSSPAVVYLNHVSTSATATLSHFSLAGVGMHVVGVDYPGDEMHTGSEAMPITLTAEPDSSTVNLSVPASTVYGATVQVVATVIDARTGNAPLGGSVSFADASGVFATAPVVNGSTAATYTPGVAGSVALSASFTPATDSNAAATGTATLTVAPAATTTTLAQVASQSGGALQFLATVTSASGTPSGMVELLNGMVVLGIAPLVNGSATFSVAPTALGTPASLIAEYQGSIDDAPSSSSPIVATGGTAGAGGTTAQAAPGISLTWIAANSTPTLQAGGAASLGLQVGVTGGSAFTSPVSFSVSGLPAGVTASFSPTTLPEGSVGQTVQLSLQMASSTAATAELRRSERPSSGLPGAQAPVSLGLMWLPFAFLRRLRKRTPRWVALALLVGLGAAMSTITTGCGVTANTAAAQPQTSTLTVTATSGSASQSTQVAVLVQPAQQN